METLRIGSKGEDVRKIQHYLHLAEDGLYGSITAEAVKDFQRAHKLFPDGTVGPKTLAEMQKANTGNTRTIKKIIVHCTATPEGKHFTVEDIRRMHKQQGWSDIGYHYLVYLDGTVMAGRSEKLIGAHCEGQNTNSIGICYVGGVAKDGKTAKDTRTEAQKKSLEKKVEELCTKYFLSKSDVYGHYQFSSKACPSFNIEDLKKHLK